MDSRVSENWAAHVSDFESKRGLFERLLHLACTETEEKCMSKMTGHQTSVSENLEGKINTGREFWCFPFQRPISDIAYLYRMTRQNCSSRELNGGILFINCIAISFITAGPAVQQLYIQLVEV